MLEGSANPDVQSSPIPTVAELDADVDPDASPRSLPVPAMMPIPIPFDAESLLRRSVRRPRVRRSKRLPIILKPFTSLEDTEFAVRTLTAVMHGQDPPIPYSEQTDRLSCGRLPLTL
jgi:hypothetical protein